MEAPNIRARDSEHKNRNSEHKNLHEEANHPNQAYKTTEKGIKLIKESIDAI